MLYSLELLGEFGMFALDLSNGDGLVDLLEIPVFFEVMVMFDILSGILKAERLRLYHKLVRYLAFRGLQRPRRDSSERSPACLGHVLTVRSKKSIQ